MRDTFNRGAASPKHNPNIQNLKTPTQPPINGYRLHGSVEKEVLFKSMHGILIQVLRCGDIVVVTRSIFGDSPDQCRQNFV